MHLTKLFVKLFNKEVFTNNPLRLPHPTCLVYLRLVHDLIPDLMPQMTWPWGPEGETSLRPVALAGPLSPAQHPLLHPWHLHT